MKVATVIFIELLKQTGFVQGFFHGAVRKTTYDILESEIMNLVFNEVIESVRGQPKFSKVTKEDIKHVAKLVLEFPILIQKYNKSSNVHLGVYYLVMRSLIKRRKCYPAVMKKPSFLQKHS